MKTKSTSRWVPPGWPWELEAMVLLFVVGSILFPFCMVFFPERAAEHAASFWQRALSGWTLGHGYLWALVIGGMYFLHVVWASLTLEYVSTPFIHLLSPTLFAGVGYFRVYGFGSRYGICTLGTGSLEGFLGWIAGVQAAVLVVAWVRKRRHLRRFRGISWDISLPPHFDRTYLAELIFKIHPLFYPPRVYRACGEGILIEGWTYIMPLPFFEIEGIVRADRGDFVSSAFYAATSMRALLRIRLYDNPRPVFISPSHPNLFFRYCQQLLAGRRPADEEARAARRAELAARTVPYGEPQSDEDRDNPYFNV